MEIHLIGMFPIISQYLAVNSSSLDKIAEKFTVYLY